MGGVEVGIKNLSKSFGSSNIWSDVTLTLPAGEVSVLLGPSGTGKSVLLKSIIGLLKPEKGSIFIHDTDLVRCSESRLYEIRKLFGVLFQDGALFGSMNLYDNIAFPLREHTRKGESEIKNIVMEKLDLVGLSGAEDKLPGEISGGMKKRAGLARALVLDPQIILVDEPDSGLDPVRTAYLNQLIVDLNTQLDATILIVTHHLGTARSLPDNIGMLFRRNLVMFGPREVLLTSEEPVVQQFLQGRRVGPIGMSEEKDSAQMEAEMAELKKQGGSAESEDSFIDPQLLPTEGLGERRAVQRRKDRVMQILHTLPEKAQSAILESLTEEDMERYGISRDVDRTEVIEITRDNPPEDADPFGHRAMEEAEDHSMTEGAPADQGGERGSGDPDGDPEAREAPPAPPESDEPLVGVPVDDYAGGTVVLPQAGEHTKDESEKSDAAGGGSTASDESDADGSEGSEQEEPEAQGAEQADQQEQQESGSRESATEDQDRSDSAAEGEPDEATSAQHTEQIPVAAASRSDDGRSDDEEPSGGRHAAVDEPAAESDLVDVQRSPDREQSARGDERGGWAARSDGQQGPGEAGGAPTTADEMAGAGASGDPAAASQGSSSRSSRREGGLRRLFRKSGS